MNEHEQIRCMEYKVDNHVANFLHGGHEPEVLIFQHLAGPCKSYVKVNCLAHMIIRKFVNQ